MIPILLIMLLLPFAGILLAGIIDKWANYIASLIGLLEIVLFIYAAHIYMSSGPFSESFYFIPGVANFELIVNNLNIVFLFLTTIVFFASYLSNGFFIKEERSSYNMLNMLAQSTVLGMFLSGNLLILYLFWDVSIILFFFILFHFGGLDRRYASIKFALYSLFSGSLLLIGIIMIYFYLPMHSFEISYLMSHGYQIPINLQLAIFILLMISFLIKIPSFPLHSWAPDAYSEATPGGAMLLAGVVSKFGIYGMLILFLSLPIARSYSFEVASIFAISALYGSIVALSQKNIKRMLAYLSISEMGIIGFAVSTFNVIGISGAIFGSLSHALIISLLFMLVFLIEKVFGTSMLNRLNNVIVQYPLIGYSFLFGILATIGLPLTTGFITDLLVLIGGDKSFGLLILLPAAAIILNAAYLLWTYERSFLVGENMEIYDFVDENAKAAIALLALFIVIIGVMPSILLNMVGTL